MAYQTSFPKLACFVFVCAEIDGHDRPPPVWTKSKLSCFWHIPSMPLHSTCSWDSIQGVLRYLSSLVADSATFPDSRLAGKSRFCPSLPTSHRYSPPLDFVQTRMVSIATPYVSTARAELVSGLSLVFHQFTNTLLRGPQLVRSISTQGRGRCRSAAVAVAVALSKGSAVAFRETEHVSS